MPSGQVSIKELVASSRAVFLQVRHEGEFLGSTQGMGPSRPSRRCDPWGGLWRSVVLSQVGETVCLPP